jgi:lanosterol synthase
VTSPRLSYDVSVIGGGPVGCVTALAFARKGADVLLLEANPRASERLAGEWLHPPGVEVLEGLGIHPDFPSAEGQGFVVFPDDGSEAVQLAYAPGTRGLCCEHQMLVSMLRSRAAAHPRIEYIPFARATDIEDQWLRYRERNGTARSVWSNLIVGAAGRQTVVHQSLNLPPIGASCSRMAGLTLYDTKMPMEGFGHVFLGGPGPVLAYRIDPWRVRVCMDVPFWFEMDSDRAADLWDAFRPVLPESLRPATRSALESGTIAWAANQVRPRVNFGRPGLALVGDSVGCHHPLTAAGMTLGFEDAVALAEGQSFEEYRRSRIRSTRLSELLAVSLYEAFADTSDEVVPMRSAIYELWRRDPAEQRRTMAFLAAQDKSPLHFTLAFLKTMGLASRSLAKEGRDSGRWGDTIRTGARLGHRIRRLFTGTLDRRSVSSSGAPRRTVGQCYGSALEASRPRDASEIRERAPGPLQWDPEEAATALDRGLRHLESLQRKDGSWEGEVVWCPMLAAQYVLTAHIIGAPIDDGRRRRLLRHFEVTRHTSGGWGLHELSEPYLFVTSLVYVAARLLGVAKDDPLLESAGRFLQEQGGVVAIPTWGKFWLAMLNLYPWKGLNPILPELWGLPRWLPLHPSKLYCHTRYIYLAMALIYGHRHQAPRTPVIDALRDELFPDGFDRIDTAGARRALRAEEIHTPPSRGLKLAYRLLRVADGLHLRRGRERLLRKLCEEVRFELRATDHSSLSPVSGLLNVIALWLENPRDADLSRAWEGMARWMWEDEDEGCRLAGARSATWDTSLAMQVIATAAPGAAAAPSLARGEGFLEAQQIRHSLPGADEADRLDTRGGYSFGHAWHGWPVSDCTAEALTARLALPNPAVSDADLTAGVNFILRRQNGDGGFGSYESGRGSLPLEWLNPAEIFGGSMTDDSHVECTASSLVALSEVRRQRPELLPAEIDPAVQRGRQWLRRRQESDGSWRGTWGVNFLYGTLFGIRGLLAAGMPAHDPRIRKACSWITARQRQDGGWGECHTGRLTGAYVEHRESQVIHTAWALTALLDAEEPDWRRLQRGARFLARAQTTGGDWPKQDPAGVFFRTALMDYTLYRSYFPVQALGLFEARRKQRLGRKAVVTSRQGETPEVRAL